MNINTSHGRPSSGPADPAAAVPSPAGPAGMAGVSDAQTSSPMQRKERGAIAAQACETCRSRKQRCDEQRPRCGTCQKFRLECHYREPQPTKKDRTLGEILDRLKAVEHKIDLLGQQKAGTTTTTATATATTSLYGSGGPASSSRVATASPPPFTEHVSSSSNSSSSSAAAAAAAWRATGAHHNYTYRYSPAVYQVLGWPVVQQMLQPLEAQVPRLRSLAAEHEARSLVLGLHHPRHRLPHDSLSSVAGTAAKAAAAAAAAATAAGGHGPLGFPPQYQASIGGGSPGASHVAAGPPPPPPPPPPPLSWDLLYRLSSAYFETLHFLAPVVDRQTFHARTLPAVLDSGFDDSGDTVLACLVFALGEAALAGVQGAPVVKGGCCPGGVRGGTLSHPPGLLFFNEARARMGYVLGDCSLEAVQIYALAGVYCSTCLRHMDYWRFTTSASLACLALITSRPSELLSPRADLIRRIFWYCVIVETHFHLDLGLPLTGLEKLEDVVGVPSFSSGPYAQDGDDYLASQASHFQEHFAAQIVWRKLCVAFHNALRSANLGPREWTGEGPSAQQQPQPPSPYSFAATVHQMALQLDGWRNMLPEHLRWQEFKPAEFPNIATNTSYGSRAFSAMAAGTGGDGGGGGRGGGGGGGAELAPPPPLALPLAPPLAPPPAPPLSSSPSSSEASTMTATSTAMFSADLAAPPAEYPFALDLQVAVLRTRYYYSKYLLFQPFLYKAIHFPEQLSGEDAAGAAACLQACLRWPVAMSPTCAHKRLVPCLFFCTQNLLSVLVLLRLAQQLPALQRIQATLCGGGDRFARAARETAALAIAWIRDLRAVDRPAEWAWDLVKGLYQLEE